MSSNNTYTITEQQRSNFKPTYLYIKQHSITGLKYLGKTTRDPNKYKGSGTRWKNHLKKHGNSINTTWIKLFYDIDTLVKVSLLLSDILNIVESKNWANMRPEDGLSGGDTSKSKNYKQGMITRDISGEKNPMFGRSRPDTANFLKEAKQKMIKANNCPVNCEGIDYPSVGEAQKQQKHFPGINIRKRLDNPKYPTFYRLRERTKRK
jgi:hypothetical protein